VEDELVGKLLGGRYRVMRRLSQGGMGVVYEATQEDLGRRVALKVMHPGLAQSHTAIERFRREALAAAALSHPHIVQITDLVRGENEPSFLVMELLSGESLETAIQASGPMAAERVLFITGQVLDALGAAHRAGIVHRDLKPANIFLTQLAGVADVVKLLDFGTAKLRETEEFARLTQAGQLVGTPLFMAPEQARGEDVDGRADIYSLGMVMYVALTARAPFPTDDPAVLLKAIQDSAPEPLARLRPDLPADLVALVEQASSKDQAGRFSNVDAMRGALAASGGTRMRADHAAATSVHPRAMHASSAKSPAKSSAKSRLGLWLALAAFTLLLVSSAAALVIYMLTREPDSATLAAASAPPSNRPALAAPLSPQPAAQLAPAMSPEPVAAPEHEKLPEGRGTPAADTSRRHLRGTPTPGAPPSAQPAPSLMPGTQPSAEPAPSPSREASDRGRPHRRANRCVPEIRLSPGRTYGLYSSDKLAAALRAPSAQAARCASLLPDGVASIPSMQLVVGMDGAVGRAHFLGSLPSGARRAGSCLRRSVESFSAGPTETGQSGVIAVRVDLTPCTPPPWNSGG